MLAGLILRAPVPANRIARLAGDFNDHGVVDAADTTVWRDSLGQSGVGLSVDADGSVTLQDYGVWVDLYQQISNLSQGRASSHATPEPSSAVLCLGVIG